MLVFFVLLFFFLIQKKPVTTQSSCGGVDSVVANQAVKVELTQQKVNEAKESQEASQFLCIQICI